MHSGSHRQLNSPCSRGHFWLGLLTSYSMRGIVYFGDGHFMACVMTNSGTICFYDDGFRVTLCGSWDLATVCTYSDRTKLAIYAYHAAQDTPTRIDEDSDLPWWCDTSALTAQVNQWKLCSYPFTSGITDLVSSVPLFRVRAWVFEHKTTRRIPRQIIRAGLFSILSSYLLVV